MNFQTYLNTIFKSYPNTYALLRFKKHMTEKMEKRAAKIRKAGMNDEQVLYDLVVDLYPNLEERFSQFDPTIYTKQSLWDLAGQRGVYGI